jgi:hypothetical protein
VSVDLNPSLYKKGIGEEFYSIYLLLYVAFFIFVIKQASGLKIPLTIADSLIKHSDNSMSANR